MPSLLKQQHKLERWKYTDLMPKIKHFGTKAVESSLVYKSSVDIVQNLADAIENNPPEWLVTLLQQPPAGEDKYGDMALWQLCNEAPYDGIIIDIPAGQTVDKAVDITLTGNEGKLSMPRMIFRLGEGAELTIIEHHKGEGNYWHNALSQIIIGANAKLRHYRVQENSDKAVYTQNTYVTIERDGSYEHMSLVIGAELSRNQIHAELAGDNGSCNIYGLNMLKNTQVGDTTITLEHKAPHCNSNQLIRSVIDDRARGVFQGKVHVHRQAQKSDAYQLSNAILLSEGAEMDTKPELEIYADDVKCSHGATTSQLDEEPLFYIRSRGVPLAEARMLLLESFMADVVAKINCEQVQDIISAKIEQFLKELSL